MEARVSVARQGQTPTTIVLEKGAGPQGQRPAAIGTQSQPTGYTARTDRHHVLPT
jgi:hypothetical protein